MNHCHYRMITENDYDMEFVIVYFNVKIFLLINIDSVMV